MKMNHTSALAGFALLFGLGCGARTILSDRVGLEDDGGAVAIADDGAITGFSGSSSSSSSGSGGTGGVAGGGPTLPTGAGSSSGGSSGGVDAGGGGVISCGNVACTVGIQQCCVAAAGGRGGMSRCSPAGQCPGNTTVLTCSGSASCARGQVCCLGGGGGGMTSNCAVMCGRGGGGGGAAVRQLCASTAECPAAQLCQPTGTGFSACVPAPIRDAGGLG